MKCANCGKIIQPDTEGWICWRKARKYFCEQKCFDEFNLKEAAPGLLEALEDVFKEYGKPIFQGDPYTLSPLMEQVRAAIAKAKGESC